uniref:Lipocalin n=1 Tax=Rhipicephalus zambeziensis TaxID=60191 RepID=A0A224YNQ6_9ACAR
MALALQGILIMVGVASVSGRLCTPLDTIAQALDDPPNALRLMQDADQSYFLVYHSKDRMFQHKYPCLRATRKAVHKNKTTYEYDYQLGPKITIDYRLVELDKTDDAYPYPNEFSIDIRRGSEKWLQDFQILYTDYKNCVLFSSWSLGYQVWMESSYLKEKRKVPEVCAFLYQLLEPRNRYVVYKGRKCLK